MKTGAAGFRSSAFWDEEEEQDKDEEEEEEDKDEDPVKKGGLSRWTWKGSRDMELA